MPVYQWEFADANALVLGVGIAKGQNPRMALGPVHSAALNYFFPNLSNTAAIDAPNLLADSQLLSNDMVQMWTHFVKTGTPRSSNLGNWPRFDASTSNHNVMQFVPKQIHLIDATANHQCDFWEGIDSKLNPIDLKP